MQARPGQPTPMGSTPDAGGTNFAVYSASASMGGVGLCLFADDGTETRLPMTARTGDIWHAYVPGVGAGQRYEDRSTGRGTHRRGRGPMTPSCCWTRGRRRSTAAMTVTRSACAHLPTDRTSPVPCDSAPHTPRSVVVNQDFYLGRRRTAAHRHGRLDHLRNPRARPHQQHPVVPDPLKGTYAGLANEPIIAHLTSLGITAVELMPVHQLPAATPVPATDYWGYMTVGFFAPAWRL